MKYFYMTMLMISNRSAAVVRSFILFAFDLHYWLGAKEDKYYNKLLSRISDKE